MSYQIGQFRRPQSGSYYIPLGIELDYQGTRRLANEDIIFYDACGLLSDSNVMNNKNSYYLRFGVRQQNDAEQTFYLKLRNNSETEDNEQIIQTYTVKRGTDIVYFENIISPNDTYNQIIWELERTALDYRTFNPNGTYGRIMEVSIENYAKLIDILSNNLKSIYPNLKYLTKVGIQGPPALLMCINGEQIRIGKSGIYELNNGMNITSISFIPKQSRISSDGLDYFIMDFEYE